jgi:hypothetical protein
VTGIAALSAEPPAINGNKCITVDDPLEELFEEGRTLLSPPLKSAKLFRPDWQPSRRRGRQPMVTTLFNFHSRESIPVLKGNPPPDKVLDEFFRCRGFGSSRRLDPRLLEAVLAAAEHFKAPRAEIISAYRSEKFNDALSKKGRNVADESRHTKGEAIDFSLPGARVRQVSAWLWENFEGGIGTYERDNFIHIDVGPKRRWKGR